MIGLLLGDSRVSIAQIGFAQQSVHLTLGILRTSQAVSYALSFFWLDGFAVPAPAQVTQTVGRSLANLFINSCQTLGDDHYEY
jgi:ABC-type nitrate/sulfonate/bicarbonate transport system permease component